MNRLRRSLRSCVSAARHALRGAVVAVLSTLCALPLAAQEQTVAERPALVVFPFESVGCAESLGRKMMEMFHGHAWRRDVFVVTELAEMEDLLSDQTRVTLDTPPATVARLTRETFQAQVAIWGRLERRAPDAYRLSVRILDLRRENPEEPALSRSYDTTLHGTMLAVDEALDEFLGVAAKTPRNLLADDSWRSRKNLVVNGDFEQGVKTPAGWEPVDGMAIFWESDVSPTGKCIRFDTMVNEPQYKAWRKAFEAGMPAEKAPPKIPPRPPYYDTIGGTVGAHVYSDPIPIRQGAAYRLDFDYLGAEGASKVFVKGYAPFYDKARNVTHREVYRLQVNLYPDQGGQVWTHDARVFHPSQPFILLTIRSDFDGGKTGARVRALLAGDLKELGVQPIQDLEDTLRRIRGYEDILRYDASKHPVTQMVQNRLGRGVVVWGEVAQEGEKMELKLRSLDVRKDAVTKDLWHTTPLNEDRLAAQTKAAAGVVVENARLVTFLRVKLDAYWPAGDYYFDNVWITEEPESDSPAAAPAP